MCLYCRMGDRNHCGSDLYCSRACQLDVLVLLLWILLLFVDGSGRASLAAAMLALAIVDRD